VVAVDGQKSQTQIGKRSLLPLIHTHVLHGSWLDVIPFLTGDTACPTTGTPALIEEKAILCHLPSPLFS
jgi:hypothetical protein